MFKNLGNLADLMRNAGKLRETMEKADRVARPGPGRGDGRRRGGHGQGQRPAGGARRSGSTRSSWPTATPSCSKTW